MWRYRFQSPPPQDELSHHGIRGQKWGIRRFQYDNGSYTPEGKERYGRGSNGKTGGWFHNRKKSVSPDQVKQDFADTMKTNRDAVKRIQETETELLNSANALQKKYKKVYSEMDLDADSRKDIWRQLHIFYGDAGPDKGHEELFESDVHIMVDDYVTDNSIKKLRSEQNKFNALRNQYTKDIHNLVDPLLDKYKDTEVRNPSDKYWSQNHNPERFINDLANSNFSNSALMYILKNESAFFTFDTPEYDKAVEKMSKEFTIEEYNRRYGN